MQRSPTCENCQRNYELKEFRPVGLKIPLLLPCGHTFCEGCLTKSAKMHPEINCFTCEEKFPLNPKGEAGVKNFVPNIYLLGLLLYNRRIALESNNNSGPRSLFGPISCFNGVGRTLREKQIFPGSFTDELNKEQKDGAEKSDEIICEECSLRHATCQCKNCENVRLCEGCFRKVHSASKMLNKHAPLPLEYPSEEELTCQLHQGRELEFYDKELNEAVCAMCMISERCQKHEIVLLTDLNNEADTMLEDSVTKAEETLSWLQHSSKVLTNALPEELFECNDLYSEIHSKFTACHTMLLKRQIELTMEASEKLSASGSINNMLQDISSKIKELSTTVKDYEMIKNNKNVLKLKSNDLVEKFSRYSDAECIVERIEEAEDAETSLVITEETPASIERIGEIISKESKKFKLKKLSDFDIDDLNDIKSRILSNESDLQKVVKSNEILDEQIEIKQKKISRLLLPAGNYELVYVTDPKTPNDFKVQRYADKDRLEVLMTSLNKYCRHSTSTNDYVYKTEEGQLVCAQFMVDNMWYRARVINAVSPNSPDKVPTWQNGLTVEVLYIDYGNSEWLPLNRLRQLKNEFLEIPEMAVPCSLTDIVPPYKEVTWPARSIKAFHSLTGDRPLLMNIRKRMGGKIYVDLRKPEDDEPTLDDGRPISVRDALVFLEVAVFASPASQPNSDFHKPVRSYTPAEKLEKGAFLDVTVTHAENPHLLHIQRLDSIIASEQQYLSNIYNGRNKKAWKMDWPYRNLVVAARFSVDQTWYRGLIKRVNIDETVEVDYVDYGNSETLSFEDLKKIPDMFIKIPIQCWKVKMYGIGKGDDEWSEVSKLFLQERFVDKPLVAAVRDIDEDGIPIVELYDTTTSNDVNMSLLLIQQGVVKDLGMIKKPIAAVTTSVDEDEDEILEGMEEANGKVEITKYLPPCYPTDLVFSATGVFVDQQANIFLHVNDDEDTSLTDIMQYLNTDLDFPNPPTSTTQLTPGQACAGKFSQDDLWYRVEIVDIVDNKRVNVYFIDFGNTEVVDCESLATKAYYIETQAQCLKMRLSGIKENIKQENYGWSDKAIAFLTNEIVSEELIVHMQSTSSHYPRKCSIKLMTSKDLTKTLIESNLVKHDLESSLVSAPELLPLPSDEESINIEEKPSHPKLDNYTNATDSFFNDINIPIDVTVTQVDRPDILYIQYNKAEQIRVLDELSDTINAEGYFDNVESIAKPYQGMACIAKYTDDDIYYRARVESFDDDMGTANVLFVDYGNSEDVPLTSLKPIPIEQLELPIMSIQARVSGISPPQLPEDKVYQPKEYVRGTKWLLKHMDLVYDIVANKKMSAVIKNKSITPIEIDLFDASNLSESGGGELMSVAQLMVDSNIAQYSNKDVIG